MVQCCDLGGLRYLNDDGSVDIKALEKQSSQLMAEMRGEGYGEAANMVQQALRMPCRCPCHRKNNPAIH